jgi:hypothetical protein
VPPVLVEVGLAVELDVEEVPTEVSVVEGVDG